MPRAVSFCFCFLRLARFLRLALRLSLVPWAALALGLLGAVGLASPAPARADAACVTVDPDGVVRPAAGTPVRLVEETVRIDVLAPDHVEYRVVYDFENPAELPVRVAMGFPERRGEPALRLLDFTVWDVDVKAGCAFRPGPSPAPGPVLDWYVIDVNFGPHEKKRITNTYRTAAVADRGLWSCGYLLHTAAGWSGPVGRLDAFVSLAPGLLPPGPGLHAAGIDLLPPGWKAAPEGNIFSRHFDDLEPTPADDLVIRFLRGGRPFAAAPEVSSAAPGPDPQDPARLRHGADRLFDGDRATAWCSAPGDDGVGQWAQLDFGVAGGYAVYRVGILGGCPGAARAAHARVKAATLEFSDGSTRQVRLTDSPGMQFFEVGAVQTTQVRVRVDEVWPGTTPGSGVCISELEAWSTN
ncbi:MAG: discoidin domain-containing protein [Desulfovibrionaceae bacterium]